MAVEFRPEVIVSDAAVKNAFIGTDFGVCNHRQLIGECLLKMCCVFCQGHKQQMEYQSRGIEMNIHLQRQPDGFIDWGRHATVNGVRGYGSAKYYTGEAAKVMELVIKHSKGKIR